MYQSESNSIFENVYTIKHLKKLLPTAQRATPSSYLGADSHPEAL